MTSGSLSCLVLLSCAAGCAESAESPDALAPAPSFALVVENGVWWLADPAGNRFFSLGVCVVDQGIGREAYDPAKPGYASWRHYAEPGAWAGLVERGPVEDDARAAGAERPAPPAHRPPPPELRRRMERAPPRLRPRGGSELR